VNDSVTHTHSDSGISGSDGDRDTHTDTSVIHSDGVMGHVMYHGLSTLFLFFWNSSQLSQLYCSGHVTVNR